MNNYSKLVYSSTPRSLIPNTNQGLWAEGGLYVEFHSADIHDCSVCSVAPASIHVQKYHEWLYWKILPNELKVALSLLDVIVMCEQCYDHLVNRVDDEDTVERVWRNYGGLDAYEKEKEDFLLTHAS